VAEKTLLLVLFMSIKRNVIANYASQIYITLIAIVMVPAYLNYMGTEAYGLVGFFGVMQGWLQLMDMGLTSTLSREVASYRAGGISENLLNSLLRSLVALFSLLFFLVGLSVWLLSDLIACSWLQTSKFSTTVVAQCICIMGFAAACRWMSGLYRGIIAGWEHQVWLGGYNIAIATVRFVGVLAIFIYVGTEPTSFFVYQLIVAILELILLWLKSGTFLPSIRSWPCFKLEPLRAMWHFSGALAFGSVIWVFITQMDKLILSKTLTLSEYGYFTMAVMIASGVSLVANPISGALMPRLTYLATCGDTPALHNVYRSATQWVSIVVWPAAGMAAFFAEPLLFAWTGNSIVSQQAGPILFWYAFGNACFGIAAFQFYLQFAYGSLRLHMIGNAVFVVLFVPGIVWAAINYGAVGAGRMWFAENVVFLFIWAWIVHHRFAPGLHVQWLISDVLPIAISAIGMSWFLSEIITLSSGRLYILLELILIGILSITTAALASSSMRNNLRCFSANFKLKSLFNRI
jgi:O-antigen/teichoic acid export membrane protein